MPHVTRINPCFGHFPSASKVLTIIDWIDDARLRQCWEDYL